MKLSILLGALLLSASPVVAQYNSENNCIINKRSELKVVQESMLMASEKSQQPEMVIDLVR